jgi:hypothetical protein
MRDELQRIVATEHTVNKLHSAWAKDNPADSDEALHSAVLDQDGRNLLYLAAHQGHAEICGLLIDAGLNVKAKTTNSWADAPVHFAIQAGSVQTVKLLRDRGAELVYTGTQSSTDKCSPLYLAVTNEKPNMVQYLIDCAESFDDPRTMVSAMAMAAVRRRSHADRSSPGVQIANMLIQSGIDLQMDHRQQEPECRLARNGHFDLFGMIESRKDVSYDDALLRAAVDGGNVDLCRHVIANGAKLKHDPAEDESMLRLAMVQYRLRVLRLFRRQGPSRK